MPLYATATDLTPRRIAYDEVAELCTEGEFSDITETAVEDAAAIASGADPDGATPAVLHVAAILSEVIAWAEGRVNSFAGVRYSVPILASDGTVPPEIHGAVIALARHYLYARRGAEAPAAIAADYDEQIAWLMAVAAGKAAINLLTASNVPDERARGVVITKDPAMFSGANAWF